MGAPDDDGPGTTVVVASDAFKGSLTSLEVGDAVRRGLLDVVPSARVQVVAVADGGEGTVAAALASGWTGVPVQVHGPTGAPVTATVAVSDRDSGVVRGLDTAAPSRSSVESAQEVVTGGQAAAGAQAAAGGHAAAGRTTVLVELADACGLGRLPGGVPAPLTASSRGLGEAVRAALDLGPDELVVGIGGSASTDGGAGLLAALGARVLDSDGHVVPDGGAALARAARLDLSGLDRRLAGIRLVLAADVDSPLLGPSGAAAVFAPQKGATPDDVVTLEAALTTWASVVGRGAEEPGAGAAGGVGFALLAVLGAERRPGVEVVLDLVDLETALTGADLVVTGEGALDAQTLTGKAVTGVARRARAAGVPVVAVCGRLDLEPDALATIGVGAAYPLSDLEPDPTRSVTDAADLLRRMGRRIARDRLSPARG